MLSPLVIKQNDFSALKFSYSISFYSRSMLNWNLRLRNNHRTHHRFIEWFKSEGTFKGYLVQLPWIKQGYLQLDQAAQSPIQPDLECLQGWGIHHLSGQTVPVPHHSYCNVFFSLISNLNLLSFSLKPFFPCPVTTDLAEECVPFFLRVPP